MIPLAFNLFYAGENSLGANIIEKLNLESAQFEIRQFPDGESYVRVDSEVANRKVILIANLHQPDHKFLCLAYLCETLKELGAAHITLISPYLPYMRQDIRFKPGEAVTSRIFARYLSGLVDKLITIDPHLHRYNSLDEIYSIPTTVLSANRLIADWIKQNVNAPLIIGPDSESAQWAAETAELVGCPHLVLEKTRHGDRDVEIAMPDISHLKDHSPVLVDDIISTGRTMIQTAQELRKLGLKTPTCIGVHALFSDDAFCKMKDSNIMQIVTCDTIPHKTNGVSCSPLLEDLV
ncbi:MAG: ribose-phosphate pyrophosphokinase [Hahellaceae bacterium]|nr:ribose-phosphate pyrophosphokinase [Hahellaceae bacterium]